MDRAPAGSATLWDVGDVSQKKFGAHGNDLSGMGHGKDLLLPAVCRHGMMGTAQIQGPAGPGPCGNGFQIRGGSPGFTHTHWRPARASATRASTSSFASAARTSSSLGRVQGCRGVNTVQQSS